MSATKVLEKMYEKKPDAPDSNLPVVLLVYNCPLPPSPFWKKILSDPVVTAGLTHTSTVQGAGLIPPPISNAEVELLLTLSPVPSVTRRKLSQLVGSECSIVHSPKAVSVSADLLWSTKVVPALAPFSLVLAIPPCSIRVAGSNARFH